MVIWQLKWWGIDVVGFTAIPICLPGDPHDIMANVLLLNKKTKQNLSINIYLSINRGFPHSVVANVLFCDIMVSEFELQSRSNPVGWGYRIHQLHLWRRVRPLRQQMFLIWHKKIWWWGSSNAGSLRNTEFTFIAIAHRFTLARNSNTW